MYWHSADIPPPGVTGSWTDPVVVFTQCGTLRQLTYYHGPYGGLWQCLNDMTADETPQFWCPLPSPQHRALAEAYAIIRTYRHPETRPPHWGGALDAYADAWLEHYATP